MIQPLNWQLYACLAGTALLGAFWKRLPVAARLGENGRHGLLLAFSLALGAVFYPRAWLGWMVFGAFLCWVAAWALQSRTKKKPNAQALLWATVIVVAMSVLIIRERIWAATVWQWFGLTFGGNASTWENTLWSGIAAPLGVSYAGMRLISLLFDAGRGRLAAPPSLLGVLNFALFFPTFAAGPLDRFERFCEDVRRPAPLRPGIIDAIIYRGTWGLFQKVVLADALLAPYAFPASGSANVIYAWNNMPVGSAWIAFYAYAGLLYFDFAGYSCLAICAGRLWGVRVPENFDKPYLARNITEFWRRWHISLSEWLRDYIFMPLGMTLMRGSLRGRSLAAGFWAAITTFAVCGIWHGWADHYIVWGLYHGLWIFIHKAYLDIGMQKIPPAWWNWSRGRLFGKTTAILLTFHGVAISWVFFAAPNVSTASNMLKKIFFLS